MCCCLFRCFAADLTAHAAQSDEPVPVDVTSSRAAGLNLAAQDLLPYAEQLKAAGFDLVARKGELFAQRGSASSTAASSSSSSRSRRTGGRQPSVASTTPTTKQAPQQPATSASAAKPVTTGLCSVPQDFSEERWLPLLQPTGAGGRTSSSSTSGIATAPPAAGAKAQGWLEQAGLPATEPGPHIRSFVPTPKHSASSSSSRSSQQQVTAVRDAVVKVLQAYTTPEQLLQQLVLVSPAWAANAYHLVPLTQDTDTDAGSISSSGSSTSLPDAALVVVDAPTPAEASAVLQTLARTARRTLQPAQVLSLVRGALGACCTMGVRTS
jgi:hypothetical protein